MHKLCFALLLTLVSLPAFAQKKAAAAKPSTEASPTEPAPGPNGPFTIPANPMGAYKPSATYNFGDMVEFQNTDYVSLASGNEGNKPEYSSTVWLLLPGHHEQATLAVHGSAIVKAGNGPVELPEEKHFKNASSYTCAPTSEVLAPPATEEKPLVKGKPPAKPQKTKVNYKSGRAFEFEEVHGNAIGYICSGS